MPLTTESILASLIYNVKKQTVKHLYVVQIEHILEFFIVQIVLLKIFNPLCVGRTDFKVGGFDSTCKALGPELNTS